MKDYNHMIGLYERREIEQIEMKEKYERLIKNEKELFKEKELQLRLEKKLYEDKITKGEKEK